MNQETRNYLSEIGRKGGQAKSPAKTAAARKANAARWQGHTPKTRPAKPQTHEMASG